MKFPLIAPNRYSFAIFFFCCLCGSLLLLSTEACRISGAKGDGGTIIETNLTTIAVCDGNFSCQDATISGCDQIRCTGEGACSDAHMRGARIVDCGIPSIQRPQVIGPCYDARITTTDDNTTSTVVTCSSPFSCFRARITSKSPRARVVCASTEVSCGGASIRLKGGDLICDGLTACAYTYVNRAGK